MNKRIENYILWLNRLRAMRRRTTSLILAMSLVVSGNVFWFMRGIGTALSNDPVCGIEEHVHTDGCYEKVLVCGEEHEHTDACYETKLICGLEEHTHTDACYIESSLLRENAEDWEKTIPELSGVYSADLLACAASQTGYTENDDGYTRYGDWYGNPSADWNVMFISFCMHYAGIKQDQIPSGAGCWAWQVKLEEKELLITDLTVLPGPGNIVLIDQDNDGKCDRAGIAADVSDGVITVIEGDVEGKVATVVYKAEDIFGYVSVNSLDPLTVDGTAVQTAEEAALTDETAPATVEYSAVTESGIEVKTTAPVGTFPEGVTMSAADVNDEDVIAHAENAVGDDKEIKGSIAVDITFTGSDGNEIEPAEGALVEVNIIIPEDMQLEANDYQLFHISEDGAAEVEGAQVSQSEAQFTAESFSIYILTATGRRSKDQVHAWIRNAGMGDLYDHRIQDPVTHEYDDYIRNDADYPYILRVGDTLTLIGHNDDQTPHFVIETGDNYSYGHTNINIVSETAPEGNEVTCVIEAVGATFWNETVRIKLEGTDEYFYVKVDDYDTGDLVINMDAISNYFPNYTTVEYTVPFGKTVTITGTPYDDEWGHRGIFLDDGVSWAITNDADMQWMPDGTVRLTFTANVFNEGVENSQILTLHSIYDWKKIKINVSNEKAIDHADIEIADGGVYTNVQIEGGNNGELFKTVTEYQSFVYDVNYSEMRDENGGVVQFYDSSAHYAPLATSRFIGGKDPYTGDCHDYWSDPNYVPGNSQYELTSKYTCPPGERFDDGHARWSTKRFFYQDVDSAIFDVELQIIPKHVQKFVWDADTNGWLPVAGTNVEYDIQYDQGTGGQYRMRTDNGAWSDWIDLKPTTNGGIVEYKNEVFELGRQAVIDAYNKCPNHSGLDFTVHHDLATIEFTASKVLTGRQLTADEFLFRMYSNIDDALSTATPAPAGVASARNDASGKIVFSNIEFENVSGYHQYVYYMKEIPGDESEMYYDPVIYKIVIDVNKVYPGAGAEGKDLVVPVDISSITRLKDGGDPRVESDYLSADQFVFQNVVNAFELPATGGAGIAPYMTAGVILIGGALILLMKKRSKEVDM